MPQPQEALRHKRQGLALSHDEIAGFVRGIADGSVGDAQIAAFTMAVCCRGMDTNEAVALTLAMRDSGTCIDWRAQGLPGPAIDKHSTGGIGDTVSLMLGPMLAACGAYVPMISGRGLGHTGGTLDKLESIPGYGVNPPLERLRRVVRETGVAIVGAGPDLAPADRRMYAVRDVTATVESVPLITASILSKKLAAGLQALVLDVKFGNGAFMPSLAEARERARSLVEVGCGAGLPTEALLTDMNEPLAPVAGNALEIRLTIDYLRGTHRPPRLDEVVRALGATLLRQCSLAADEQEARTRLAQALDSGAAAERFARMVAGLGGPADLMERPGLHLPRAPVVRAVMPSPEAQGRFVSTIDTRALGLAVVALGGGRRRVGDHIDPAVGLASTASPGTCLDQNTPLAVVHAADEAGAEAAAAMVRLAYRLADTAPTPGPLVADHITVHR